MPDIVRLRFAGPDVVTVPILGREVAPGDVVDLPGKVLTVDEAGNPLPADHDAIVVEFGNPPVTRAFPTSAWSVAKKSSRAAAAEATDETNADSSEES